MAPRPKRLRVLSTPDGLDEEFSRLKRGVLAIDTETTGLRWWQDLVGSINLAAGNSAYMFYGDALAPAARFLSDEVKQRRELVFHNAKFDMHFLRGTFGLHIPYPVHDTLVMSFLLDNRGVHAPEIGLWKEKPHGLKALASVFVDPNAQDHEKQLMAEIRSKDGRTKGDWLLVAQKFFGKYSAMDPWYTLQLYEQFIERLRHWRQPEDLPSLMSLYEQELWVILAFRDMEERGVMVHRDFLEEWREELALKLKKIRRKLAKVAGREINWNSNPQLVELLYSKRKHGGLGLEAERFSASLNPSTDEVALKMLDHPIGPLMVEYRETFKQHSSYAVGLLEAIAPDGAIHATFKSTGARTGRSSCEEPNLQQQTRESGVRKAYHPRKGLVFRFADYSQVEMRFAGHFADEPTLIKGFNNDPDFDTHKATAMVMYGIKEPNVRQRKFGKILNFTTLFGGGVNKVAEQLQERLTMIDVKQALKEMHYRPAPGESPYLALATLLKERYNAAMPNIRRASREESDIAEQREFVVNAFGRHRYIEHHKWYAAFNTKIQGTAGDQAKKGLVTVYRECQLNRGELALLLLIHDELVYESDGNPKTDRRVLELMSDTKGFKVPIIADMSGSNLNWQEKVKVKL